MVLHDYNSTPGTRSQNTHTHTHTHQRHYKIGNPFKWMEMISLQGKTTFFEKHIGEYSKSGVGVDRADQTFALDASF